MSSLLKLKTPIREELVQVSDEEAFPVRGLSPYHVVGLYFRHTGELSALVEKLATTYTANGGEFKATDTAAIVLDLAKEAPMILSELITLASGGDPTNVDDWYLALDIAQALPFPVQADAVEKIFSLTFTSDMPPGKFVRLVARAIQSATPSRPLT